MALDFPSSPNNGDTYDDSNNTTWRFDGVKWDVINTTLAKVFSGSKVTLSSIINLSSTLTALSFDTESFDVDDYFDPGSPTKFTIRENGYYRLLAFIQSSADGIGSQYDIRVRKNGTTDLSATNIGPNQTAVYDEIVLLTTGDYVEVYGSETGAVGDISTDSYFEISRAGLTPGTGVGVLAAFSGVRTTISSEFALSGTLTAVDFDGTDFNVNADVLGNTYWTVGTPERITFKTGKYYRIKCFAQVGSGGGTGTFTVTLRKNGTTVLATQTLSTDDFIDLDEVFQFVANDYIELLAKDTEATGAVLTNTYLEATRLGL